jgi:hypothetical protein
MEDKIMIAKIKDGSRLSIKIRKRMKNGFAPDDYSKMINPKDSNDLCYLFEDLNSLFDIPIDAAFRKYIERKGKGFPF